MATFYGLTLARGLSLLSPAKYNTMTMQRVLCFICLIGLQVDAFVPFSSKRHPSRGCAPSSSTSLSMVFGQQNKPTEKEANAAIEKVVRALQKDKTANQELGKLQKVNNILGFGSPRPGILAVRFNASFQKGGMGRSAVPLPFGLGQSDKVEGRGTMVGQVKASVDATSGKVLEASVFRDLGYGRSFNLKV
ncbi:predicted protein [Thalassiosira pseudonana CCMP1335]|jgi:hypothetical protein|uniref:Uncharacterized protein n=1 Tax=Thalassiosira pseudonana TaxID=35128 RepID=B8CEX6_THAPS|nr:predicted protein [Thalassiosira pseudonana CCMP1335]EED87980.1 predicted protein [Thalassiosira pseudonana CCMP1335]